MCRAAPEAARVQSACSAPRGPACARVRQLELRSKETELAIKEHELELIGLQEGCARAAALADGQEIAKQPKHKDCCLSVEINELWLLPLFGK